MDKLIDKLPPPALNRPPTQQQRVPDPGRFRSIDMQPEDAQLDSSYQRMVQDIEALQHRQGWLAGRGAFDKEDLLYLRDREEQQRMTEQQQRDMEVAAFAAARARSEREQQAAARATLRQQQPATKQNSKSAHYLGARPVLKAKEHHSRGQQLQQLQQQQQQQQQLPAGQPVQPELAELQRARAPKKPRLEVSSGANAAESLAAVSAAAAAATRQPVAAAGASCSPSVQHQGSSHAASQLNAATCRRALDDTQNIRQLRQQRQLQSKAEDSVGIQGLLGYTSESDEEGTAKLGSDGQAARIPQQGFKLPSAAELLEQDLPCSFASAAEPTPADVASVSVPCSRSAAAHQHHTGWI